MRAARDEKLPQGTQGDGGGNATQSNILSAGGRVIKAKEAKFILMTWDFPPSKQKECR
jgi:hypothetical protein